MVGIFPNEAAVIRLVGSVSERAARRVAGLQALLQCRIVSEAGAKGGGGGAAAVDGRLEERSGRNRTRRFTHLTGHILLEHALCPPSLFADDFQQFIAERSGALAATAARMIE